MHQVSYRLRKALANVGVLVLMVLAFGLAACGAGGASAQKSATNSIPATAPTPAPTAVKGYGTANGCPSDMVIGSAPVPANVIVQLTDTSNTIAAHTGDVIEVRLPFGHKWGGPMASQGVLKLASPAGYAWKTNSMCTWRFVAAGTGQIQLDFTEQPLCRKGQMCAMFIMAVSFAIDIK